MREKETYALLGKGLHGLFLLTIVNAISEIFANDTIASWLPMMHLIAALSSVCCTIGYGYILLKLEEADDQYKTAGIFWLACSGIQVLAAILGNFGGLAILISIASLIVRFYAEYNECMAHSYMLKGIDDVMSYRWIDIWKWFLGSFCALVAGTILVFIIPILGGIVVLVAVIVSFGVAIWKISSLNNTSKFFKGYSASTKDIL